MNICAHICSALAKYNQEENHHSFVIEKEESSDKWKLLGNDDDYYMPDFILYCPFCGQKLEGV